MPRRSCSPRSSNSMPDPATKSSAGTSSQTADSDALCEFRCIESVPGGYSRCVMTPTLGETAARIAYEAILHHLLERHPESQDLLFDLDETVDRRLRDSELAGSATARQLQGDPVDDETTPAST